METIEMEQAVEQIALRAEQLYQTGRTPVVIALDGMAAAGKTTLAGLLEQRLHAGVIHMDDFFLPQGFRTPERLKSAGGNVYYERFCREVLPFLRENMPFSYEIFDCHAHRYVGRREIPAGAYRIVEGAYACHPEFGEPYDLRVFCKVSATEQMRRVRERSAEKAEMFEAMWIPMENRYFEVYGVEQRSDLTVVSGPEEPEPPLEIERKFLIAYPNLEELDRLCSKKAEMEQTYLLGTEKGVSRRVRKSTIDGVTYFRKNTKRKVNGTTRIERQESISEKEYQILLGFADPARKTIRKIRWWIPMGELTAEVDVFEFWSDRAVCEVELPAEDTPVELPGCLQLIREVTEDPRYTNASLALDVPMDAL